MTAKLQWDISAPRHVVAILGGAVAGSEAAVLCASRGIYAVVIEQNDRPYGKIEDGLPRWHDALRKKEYERIDQNLSQPGVVFLPRTRVGRDVSFEELIRDWGVSAVVLANGAWRDRPLEVPGIDQYVGRGLVYQNPLVYWFNHYEEPGYDGPQYDVPDGGIVVGGGLASIDVAKILNLEVYGRALRARGIAIDAVHLEHEGINKVLAAHDLTPAALGVTGCTLYYRRRKVDMPLASPPDGATADQLKKIESTRARIMDKVVEKYLVRFEECHLPVAPLVEGDRLVGLRFRRTEIRNGSVVELPGTEVDVHAPMVVSSIGSIPELIPGIPAQGELYRFADHRTGSLHGVGGVFGLGNVLTGKGNIVASRKNAREVTAQLLSGHLAVSDARAADAPATDPLIAATQRNHLCEPTALQRIADQVTRRWREIGYDGDYGAWIRRVTPAGLH